MVRLKDGMEIMNPCLLPRVVGTFGRLPVKGVIQVALVLLLLMSAAQAAGGWGSVSVVKTTDSSITIDWSEPSGKYRYPGSTRRYEICYKEEHSSDRVCSHMHPTIITGQKPFTIDGKDPGGKGAKLDPNQSYKIRVLPWVEWDIPWPGGWDKARYRKVGTIVQSTNSRPPTPAVRHGSVRKTGGTTNGSAATMDVEVTWSHPQDFDSVRVCYRRLFSFFNLNRICEDHGAVVDWFWPDTERGWKTAKMPINGVLNVTLDVMRTGWDYRVMACGYNSSLGLEAHIGEFKVGSGRRLAAPSNSLVDIMTMPLAADYEAIIEHYVSEIPSVYGDTSLSNHISSLSPELQDEIELLIEYDDIVGDDFSIMEWLVFGRYDVFGEWQSEEALAAADMTLVQFLQREYPDVYEELLMYADPPHPGTPLPVVAIEKTHNSLQGQPEYVSITTENIAPEMGGFDFLIAYDASALTITQVTPGQLLEDCSWEYFTYRHGAEGNCGDACPSGLLRIIAIAETNDGAAHPSCYGPPDTDPHELASVKFLVSNDRTYECQYVPIRFFWNDCGDNTISSVEGDYLGLDRAIYDFDGNLIWDESDDIQFPEDARFPWVGAPDYCLTEDPDKPTAVRAIDFINGGIDIVCADSIDAPGDINVNGVAYEIADAVMLTNYFVDGEAAFGDHVEASIAASDVNADGIPLSVADLVYLIRVITGDALPYSKLTSGGREVSVEALVNHSAAGVSVAGPTEIGAGLFVFEYSGYTVGEPHLVNAASDMSLSYSDNEGVLKVLVYSMKKGSRVVPGGETFLVVPISGEGTLSLTDVQMADYNGNTLVARVGDEPQLPKAYALHQNYPNPFNGPTTITYELPQTGHVTVDVFNVLGQKVACLVDRVETAGVHSAVWQGADESGATVSTGVYVYRILAEGFSDEKKMILLK